ncbi:hypothetical protein SAMN02799631_03238 [Methylobacterium sp. 174MFSha1.1]|uniref:hypothetical protein n=1 Tax=Methylobacterium sp. 174MFSha1.1 TaxID=1502749 RepID=UPI0008E6D4D4|nr:hypothetical protein [Methylobacterium sp. 174MFSha1.1]SFU93388.1 hypothetical protein SAMN02799631_03238 [Methylobacterium sp. 174MFSha1.1]
MPAELVAATQAVIDAANRLVSWRRWYLELPDDRPLPEDLAAALERALAALDRVEAAAGAVA